MTQEQINYYSELMKNFMEFKISKGVINDTRIYYEIYEGFIASEDQFEFHTNRNWLHRVWEKFRDLKFDDASDDVFGRHYAFKNTVAYCITYSAITEVFLELGKAIEWYNGLNKQS